MKELIFVYGPPGSGKSTVGKLLADGLGLRFTDLDLLIAEKSGKSIPEIFDSEGEAQAQGFRPSRYAVPKKDR